MGQRKLDDLGVVLLRSQVQDRGKGGWRSHFGPWSKSHRDAAGDSCQAATRSGVEPWSPTASMSAPALQSNSMIFTLSPDAAA